MSCRWGWAPPQWHLELGPFGCLGMGDPGDSNKGGMYFSSQMSRYSCPTCSDDPWIWLILGCRERNCIGGMWWLPYGFGHSHLKFTILNS